MKADIPLRERQRLEREQWAEIRAALVRRHFQTVQDQMAINATLARLELEQFQRAAPAIAAIMAGLPPAAAPVHAPVVMPEPVAPSAPAPMPLTIRPGVPDGLRQRLGLQ